MARRREIIKFVEFRRKYVWPEAQLNFFLLIMLVAGATILGINVYFMTVQSRLQAGQIWLFPFSIATGTLTIIFFAIILALVRSRQLLPFFVLLGTFILFALYLTGLVETSIQLYGPRGSVNSYCNAYQPSRGYEQGQGIDTLAYIATQGICNDWKAVFAFYLVGCIFELWFMVVAWQVMMDVFDD